MYMPNIVLKNLLKVMLSVQYDETTINNWKIVLLFIIILA